MADMPGTVHTVMAHTVTGLMVLECIQVWSHGIMPGGYGMGVPGANVLGGGVRYTNDKKTFSIGLNVEGIWYDNKTPSYFKKYDYPTPNNTAK